MQKQMDTSVSPTVAEGGRCPPGRRQWVRGGMHDGDGMGGPGHHPGGVRSGAPRRKNRILLAQILLAMKLTANVVHELHRHNVVDANLSNLLAHNPSEVCTPPPPPRRCSRTPSPCYRCFPRNLQSIPPRQLARILC
eukprot:6533338-Prymnesium_polylepis.1